MNSKEKEPELQEVSAVTNEEDLQENQEIPDKLPVLITGDLVAFPSVLMSLYIVDSKNLAAIAKAQDEQELVVMTASEKFNSNALTKKDLPKMGVVAQVSRVFKLGDGRTKVLLQGLQRVKIKKYLDTKQCFLADVEVVEVSHDISIKADDDLKEVTSSLKSRLQNMVELEILPEEMLLLTEEMDDPGVLSDVILAHYKLDVNYAQSLLEELDPVKRLKLTAKIIEDDYNSYLVAENIRHQTQTELTKGQRDFFLREQIKQIRKELGDDDLGSEDLDELKEKIAKLKLSSKARKEVDRQLNRLERMPPESTEYSMIRTYLDWITDLPWSKRTKEKFDIDQAQQILDEDHYGLKKAKDRILEFLCVRKLKSNSKGPILCFLGPPGVGKTSLGRSIARSVNRNFVRISLGGVRDEAEIRGHRRTYVGALPGRIVQGMKEAGSINPVFMLDELDKLASDYRGDPSAALLEVLDPQQNKDFVDHYLNIPYDLSDCFFIATANTLDTIPDALIDRLEIITIPGYTTTEKLNIARNYLIPRQTEENGIADSGLQFTQEAIVFLIERYTKESGVRGLEREIANICRKIARSIVASKKHNKRITSAFVEKALGTPTYDLDFHGKIDQVGLANGLAWTIYGGELMPVEASVAPGKGELILTGQLGSVLQESAQAAVFYARANHKILGLDANFHEEYDIHIHLPEGATPKDGPSAGITLVTALVSALSNRKVKSSVAMTGEITLRGKVLSIGGLKEKALAALRSGIKTILIPKSNMKDLEDIPLARRKEIEFIPVESIEEVLEHTLYPVKGKKSKKATSGKKSKSSGKVKPKRVTSTTVA